MVKELNLGDIITLDTGECYVITTWLLNQELPENTIKVERNGSVIFEK